MKKLLMLVLFSGLFLTACGGGETEKKTEDITKTKKTETKTEKDTAKTDDNSAPVVEEVDEDVTEDSLKTKKK